MTRLRRGLVLLALAVATTVGLTVTPAQAAFSAQTSTTASVGTITVAGPAQVSTDGTGCPYSLAYQNGSWRLIRTLRVQVSWPKSTTTRGVDGYIVTAHLRDGSSYPVATVGPGTTSLSDTYDLSYADQGIRVSITTHTTYGWTGQSPLSKEISC
ncbi:hypothetical protein [Modestobacter sp. SYSU DS0290]